MSWGSPFFVLALIAISTIGWVLTTAIRARHGYPVEGEWGGKVEHPEARRHAELLEAENARAARQAEPGRRAGGGAGTPRHRSGAAADQRYRSVARQPRRLTLQPVRNDRDVW